MAGKKGQSGRKSGYIHAEETREKIRTGVLLDIADRIANGEVKDDARMLAVRMSAITTLLRKTLPDLTATDVTSGGKSIVIERVSFKAPP